MNAMDYVGVSTIPRMPYCDLGAGEEAKPFGGWWPPNSSSVFWDVGFLSSSKESKASIEISREAQIWESPEVREMLTQPFGAPIKLTREQAIEIVKDSFGSRPELSEGREYVRDIRLALGDSIFSKSSGKSG